jgi:carbonic anhydrase
MDPDWRKIEPAEPDQSHESASIRELARRHQRFRDEIFPTRKAEFLNLSTRQQPQVLLITCSDSRIAPELILQCGPGDLFVCRNIGNMVPPYGEMLGSITAVIEYAVAVLQIKAVVICGHSDCGAMKGLMDPEKLTELPAVSTWLRNAQSARQIAAESYPNVSEHEFLEALTAENVVAQIRNLETHPAVASRLRRGDLELYGWVYKIHTGEIWTYDGEQERFVLLDSRPASATRPGKRRAAT